LQSWKRLPLFFEKFLSWLVYDSDVKPDLDVAPSLPKNFQPLVEDNVFGHPHNRAIRGKRFAEEVFGQFHRLYFVPVFWMAPQGIRHSSCCP